MSSAGIFVTASTIGAVTALSDNLGALATPDGSGVIQVKGNGIDVSTSASGHVLTINVTGGGVQWNLVSTGDPETVQMANDNGYVVNTATFTVTKFTLPTTPALGTTVEVIMRVLTNNFGFWITGAIILDITTTISAIQKYQYTNSTVNNPKQQNGAIKLICTDPVTKRWTVVRTKGTFVTI